MLMSKIPLLNTLKEKSQKLVNKEEKSSFVTKKTGPLPDEKNKGMFSFFKADKNK